MNLNFGILLWAFSRVHGFNKAETHTNMCRKNNYSVSSLYITAGFVWPCPLFSPKTGPRCLLYLKRNINNKRLADV